MALKWIDHRWDAPGQEPKVFEFLVAETGEYLACIVRWYDDAPTYANFALRERSGALESDQAARDWCERKARPN